MPIRLHVLAPLSWLVLNEDDGTRWLGMLLLAFAHGLGHAVLIRRFGSRITGIEFGPLGAEWVWQGRVSKRQEALIAWGGVLGQLVVLAAVFFLGALVHLDGVFVRRLVHVLTWGNLVLMALNLIPILPFDGVHAWRAFPLWFAHWTQRPEERHQQVVNQLNQLDRAPPPSPETRAMVRALLDEARKDADSQQSV